MPSLEEQLVEALLDQTRAVHREEFRKFAKGLVQELAKYLNPMKEHIVSLEKRFAQLEAQVPHYEGVWAAGVQYRPGTFCTDHGSVWFCRKTTLARPGQDDSWQLAVKRGERGRDSRDTPR